ncbi:MAG: hypothetical protein GY928_29040 [Colwellia sp.]|nr:hypothetical protein [Colwellia sp.]
MNLNEYYEIAKQFDRTPKGKHLDHYVLGVASEMCEFEEAVTKHNQDEETGDYIWFAMMYAKWRGIDVYTYDLNKTYDTTFGLLEEILSSAKRVSVFGKEKYFERLDYAMLYELRMAIQYDPKELERLCKMNIEKLSNRSENNGLENPENRDFVAETKILKKGGDE